MAAALRAFVGRRRRSRLTIAVVLCLVVGGIAAGPALADAGQTWLNWAYEPQGVGLHAHWYNYATQAAAEASSSNNSACTNIWLGSRGAWEFGSDVCVQGGYEAYTDQLADPGVGGYPWAQNQIQADYLWAWALYCNTC